MASGETLYSTNAQGFSRPSSAAATPDQRVGSDGTVLNVFDFDPAVNERIEINFPMPQNYDSASGIDVILHWSSETATTGNVRWEAEFKHMRDNTDDIDVKAYSAEQTTTDTTATATGQPKYTTISLTNGQAASVVAGGHVFVRITRDAIDAGDTMNSDDAELWSVEVREQ